MYVIVTNPVNWHRDTIAVGQGINRKTQGTLECNLSGYPVKSRGFPAFSKSSLGCDACSCWLFQGLRNRNK